MKVSQQLIFSFVLLLLSACTMFGTSQSAAEPVMLSPNPLALTIGKNWQVIEEAPYINEEGGHFPFQMEMSVQTNGAKPVLTDDNRKIELTH